MKRTALKQIGKRGKINIRANRILDKLYAGKDIRRCELGFENCTGGMFLGFAHRHKRVFYYQKVELLSSFNQTIIACSSCHEKIEYDRELTEKEFLRLRGEEIEYKNYN